MAQQQGQYPQVGAQSQTGDLAEGFIEGQQPLGKGGELLGSGGAKWGDRPPIGLPLAINRQGPFWQMVVAEGIVGDRLNGFPQHIQHLSQGIARQWIAQP